MIMKMKTRKKMTLKVQNFVEVLLPASSFLRHSQLYIPQKLA